MVFVEQKYKPSKNETDSKMENPRHTSRKTNLVPCASAHIRFEI